MVTEGMLDQKVGNPFEVVGHKTAGCLEIIAPRHEGWFYTRTDLGDPVAIGGALAIVHQNIPYVLGISAEAGISGAPKIWNGIR
jgi:predicted deacylase